MDNAYDIRYKDNLYYVFPKEMTIVSEEILNSKVAVFVNLYYEEDLEWYIQYLNNVPSYIDLYVISSKDTILERIKTELKKRKRLLLVRKNNRGRDISALLIAVKKYFFTYDYCCFIHDKKWKDEKLKEESILWRNNLWENMIASKMYIQNVLYKLHSEKEIGLLCPPEPIGVHMRAWYMPAWSESFIEMAKVANKLGLDAKITEDIPPVSLSNVFWCKTKALKKLMVYPWKYEDFPEEPLPVSGTINHGIERVLAYVAQDAGYKTGIIMTNKYAEYLIGFSQFHIQKTFSFIYESLGISNFSQIQKINNQKNKISDFFFDHDKVFLYGAGTVGKRALKCLRAWNYAPTSFIVSDALSVGECDGLAIIPINQVQMKKDSGVIITVSQQYRNEIINTLKAHDMIDILVWEE